MEQKKSADQYSPEETKRRMDDAIRRALNTPPKPHKEMVGKEQLRKTAKRRSARNKIT